MIEILIILLCVLNIFCAIRTWWLCDLIDALIDLVVWAEEEGE